MRTTANFVQPAFGVAFDVYVDSTEFAVEGQTLLLPRGGYYLIDSIVDDRHMLLINMGFQQNVPYGTFVNKNILVPSGTPQMSSVTVPNDTNSFDIPWNNVAVTLGAWTGTLTLGFGFGGGTGMVPMLGTHVIIADPGGNISSDNPIALSATGSYAFFLAGVGELETAYTTQYGMLDITFVNNALELAWLVNT